jgi:hypothetical protein
MSALHRWAVDVSGIPAAMSAYMFRNLCTRTGLQRTNEIDGHELNVSVYSAHVRRHADNDRLRRRYDACPPSDYADCGAGAKPQSAE